jgi:hypothetical protein
VGTIYCGGAALGKHAHKKASNSFVEKRANYSFLKESITGLNIDSYIYCFFRQFGRPIYKHDYLCLRLGFIAVSVVHIGNHVRRLL